MRLVELDTRFPCLPPSFISHFRFNEFLLLPSIALSLQSRWQQIHLSFKSPSYFALFLAARNCGYSLASGLLIFSALYSRKLARTGSFKQTPPFSMRCRFVRCTFSPNSQSSSHAIDAGFSRPRRSPLPFPPSIWSHQLPRTNDKLRTSMMLLFCNPSHTLESSTRSSFFPDIKGFFYPCDSLFQGFSRRGG